MAPRERGGGGWAFGPGTVDGVLWRVGHSAGFFACFCEGHAGLVLASTTISTKK